MNLFHYNPQRSVLRLLLFNLSIFTQYLFVEEADIMRYGEDYTMYVCSKNIDVTLEKVEEIRKILFK